jgi:hypothetical protein
LATIPELNTEIDAQLPTNATGQITASKLRTVLHDMTNSLSTTSSVTGGGVGFTFDTRAAAQSVSIATLGSGGPTWIKTTGYATVGDGGGGTYTRVSSSPTYSNLIWFQSADGQYWSLLRTNEPFHLEQAGGGTGASGAVNSAAVDAISSMFLGAYKYGFGYGFAGPCIKLGYGTYNMNGPWFLKGCCNISGMGGQMFGGYPTEVKFPTGSDGFVCGAAGNTNGRLYNTSGIYLDFDGRGSKLTDMKITGGWNGTSTTYSENNTTGQRGYGILAKGGLFLENLYVNRFAEVGVYTKGTAGGGGSSSEPAVGTGDNTDTSVSYVCAQGYANNFTYIGVAAEVVGCDGFRDIGADANAGSYINCSGTECGAWSFNSMCFLGNWFYGCHSAFGGNRWQLQGPKLDPTTGKETGSYQSTSDSSFSVFTACYSESGQAGRHIRGFCTILGGLHAAGSPQQSPTGWTIYGEGSSGVINPFRVNASASSTGGSGNLVLQGTDLNDEMMQFQTAWASFFIRAQFGLMEFGTFDKSQSLYLNLVSSGGPQQGRGTSIPYATWTISEGVFLGGPGVNAGNDCRWVGVLSAVPTSGTWARGDRVFLRDPSAGGAYGYVCTAGGTPGTWKSMGNLAA